MWDQVLECFVQGLGLGTAGLGLAFRFLKKRPVLQAHLGVAMIQLVASAIVP